MNQEDAVIWSLIVLFIVAVGVIVIIRFVFWLNNFSQELRCIKTEIRRSHGGEKKYWIRRKRRLWLSILPFVKY